MKNKARGITAIGRMIDQNYLNAIGWKGIRVRGHNIKTCLKDTIEKVSNSGKLVRLVDLASGPGRYLLETIKEIPNNNIEVLLRDWDQKNLDAGKQMTIGMGIKNVRFEKADAFNTKSILDITPHPNIIIVSGLYELFPNNEVILNSLKGIANVLDDDGYFIYTGQPWHPQVEMIARTLINRDGKAWIMRRRTQAEMDELVRSVGLKKLDMKIDPYGIFTVSLAQKVG